MRRVGAARRFAATALVAAGILAGARPATAQHPQARVLSQLSGGRYTVRVGTDTLVALPVAEYADVTRQLQKLENALALIERLERVRDSVEVYIRAVDRQQVVADSLIATQRTQIAEYQRMTTLLEKVAHQPFMRAEFGVSRVGGKFTGLAGIGLWHLRGWGLVRDGEFGLAIGASVPIDR